MPSHTFRVTSIIISHSKLLIKIWWNISIRERSRPRTMYTPTANCPCTVRLYFIVNWYQPIGNGIDNFVCWQWNFVGWVCLLFWVVSKLLSCLKLSLNKRSKCGVGKNSRKSTLCKEITQKKMDELLCNSEILILVVTTWAVHSERISHSHVMTYFFHSFFCLLVTQNSNNCLLCMATLNTTIDWHNWDLYTRSQRAILISRLKISVWCTRIIFLQKLMWPYSWIELVLAGARCRWKSEILPLVMTYCTLMRLSINRNEGTRSWFTMVYRTRSKILIIIHNTVMKPFNIYWVKLMS